MISIVWAGDKAITQPWGITDVAVEPLFELPGGWVHWHTGIDIGLYFEPIYAARAGKVVYESYGLLCVQVGGELDYYVHIDHADVAVGADVAQGQHIAVSGDKVPSGGSLTGAHLHFETRSGPLWLPGGLNLNIPTGNDPVPVLTGLFGGLGGNMDSNTTEGLAQLTFIACTGKSIDPATAAADFLSARQQIPISLRAYVENVYNDPRSVAYRAKAGGAVGPKGDPGTNGTNGKDGATPTMGTIAGPITVKLT